jgi:hypothetical protein
MTGLDHSLIYEARKFITGENVHDVRTWIFCYETSVPHSRHHARYEKLLRAFVATKRLNMVPHLKTSLSRSRLKACTTATI